VSFLKRNGSELGFGRLRKVPLTATFRPSQKVKLGSSFYFSSDFIDDFSDVYWLDVELLVHGFCN